MIRFCNGTPGQGINSNLSNKSWEPFREPIGPGSSQIVQASPLFRSAELCASGQPGLGELRGLCVRMAHFLAFVMRPRRSCSQVGPARNRRACRRGCCAGRWRWARRPVPRAVRRMLLGAGGFVGLLSPCW